jgi:hypothetical protein
MTRTEWTALYREVRSAPHGPAHYVKRDSAATMMVYHLPPLGVRIDRLGCSIGTNRAEYWSQFNDAHDPLALYSREDRRVVVQQLRGFRAAFLISAKHFL